ncbi:VanZ family protein [Saccharopolyspora griseoalba]|uniref:VanZ family protein n=1 Tax=Saccharopolyspora griseoalba TaxID=1431848 RepID=A0ABW2LRA5_9PSEU
MSLLVSWAILFTPASGVPTAPPGTDKVIHFALFAALAATGRLAGFRARWLLPALVAYAGASELAQGVLPLGRSCELLDALVDCAGTLVAWPLRRSLGARSGTSDERRRSSGASSR